MPNDPLFVEKFEDIDCTSISNSHEMVRRVEVDVCVVVAAEQVGKPRVCACKVVSSTQADDLAEQRRVTKRDVQGVISANAASVRDEPGIGIEGPRERKHFAQNVLLKEVM